MELHLIRHPRPDVEPGVCYGQLDLGIAESAAEVAERLRPHLPAEFDLHASPLQRARLLAEQFGTPRVDARLKEIHFGDWEGRPFAELGDVMNLWADDPLGFRAPQGESVRDMSVRVLDWLNALRAGPPARPVVIVAHGGPLRVIAGHLLNVPAEHWLGLDFACGQVTRLDVEPWGTVLKWFNR
ncbi:phosphoglycerate mutase [Pseudothauera nasutitermitis]|uniref:Phosphoglycerate mutase n=1 Tax=Pseudothauera nasutitermitis TaxID=2565930 RepID=A0A4S4ATG0_9RHOO|nr:alpha-ribazole phosphatase family protein [Pseudothauera nasutitermitis]THF63152.1 phosphoglycerate mutase [Pseudothauera nasutitermitis]